jgi:hypothetical protein
MVHSGSGCHSRSLCNEEDSSASGESENSLILVPYAFRHRNGVVPPVIPATIPPFSTGEDKICRVRPESTRRYSVLGRESSSDAAFKFDESFRPSCNNGRSTAKWEVHDDIKVAELFPAIFGARGSNKDRVAANGDEAFRISVLQCISKSLSRKCN